MHLARWIFTQLQHVTFKFITVTRKLRLQNEIGNQIGNCGAEGCLPAMIAAASVHSAATSDLGGQT